MHKSICHVCGSTHTVKNGKRNWVQMYKCASFGYQFRNKKLPEDIQLWKQYLANRPTKNWQNSWALASQQ